MLSENTIREYATKWQTTELNVVREYFQHRFLAALYQIPNADSCVFKGGTALRILYNSPRFSEDLDFTGTTTEYYIKNILNLIIEKLKDDALDIEVIESKSTSGGWIAILQTPIHSWPVRLEINVSTRQKKQSSKNQTFLVSPEILPSYTVVALNEKTLVEEKIKALLSRKKPRDYFDLYFILRSRLSVDVVACYQTKILEDIKSTINKSFKNELKLFLPKSHWNIINNLGPLLKKELERF